MIQQSIVLAALLLIGMVLPIGGCSSRTGDGPEKLIEVTGTVMLDGEPLPGAAVYFSPKGETAGTGASGGTDEVGKYTLIHRSGRAGVEPGDYVVMITKLVTPDGKPIPEGASAADVGAVNSLLPRYQQTDDQNPNQATVSDTQTEFDFDLKSK